MAHDFPGARPGSPTALPGPAPPPSTPASFVLTLPGTPGPAVDMSHRLAAGRGVRKLLAVHLTGSQPRHPLPRVGRRLAQRPASTSSHDPTCRSPCPGPKPQKNPPAPDAGSLPSVIHSYALALAPPRGINGRGPDPWSTPSTADPHGSITARQLQVRARGLLQSLAGACASERHR